jgi:hypothetical protein
MQHSNTTKKPHRNQHNKIKQLRIDTRVSTGYTPIHTHGLGIWSNPRVPMTVRVDKKLKTAFNEASKHFSGSTCSAIEYIMAAYVGAYKNQQINRVHPELTVQPIEIGEIKIERNLRERRKVTFEDAKANVVVGTGFNLCMIGECDKPVADVMIYQPRGKAAQEFRVCAYHSSEYAKSNAWSFKNNER